MQTGMNIKRIAVVSIPVTDQGKAKDFYVNGLGFVLVREAPMGKGQNWVELAPTAGGTSITLVTWFPTMQPGGVTGLVLETTDIDSDFEKLKKYGVILTPVEDAPWGRFTTFNDLDGNGWVLQQYAPPQM